MKKHVYLIVPNFCVVFLATLQDVTHLTITDIVWHLGKYLSLFCQELDEKTDIHEFAVAGSSS